MRSIYLLRHCETESFLKKRCIGMTDIGLNENGIRHAQCLKEFFKDKNLSGVFCSAAIRAVKTAEILSGGNIPVTRRSDLHEIDMGDWDGMCFDEIKVKFPDEYRQRGLDLATFTPPNGESFASCQKRAVTVFRNILANTGGDIAVVSHAGFNRALLCSLCCMDLQELFSIPQPYGCVNLLSLQNGICSVREMARRVDEDGRPAFPAGRGL